MKLISWFETEILIISPLVCFKCQHVSWCATDWVTCAKCICCDLSGLIHSKIFRILGFFHEFHEFLKCRPPKTTKTFRVLCVISGFDKCGSGLTLHSVASLCCSVGRWVFVFRAFWMNIHEKNVKLISRHWILEV
jgi:hypothetical protein